MDIGRLLIAATPIGNLTDASFNLVNTLSDIKYIAAEDTRTAQKLIKLLNVDSKPMIFSLHDHNETAKMIYALELLNAGNDVLLISDAGMPLVSDPGYKLVRECIRTNIDIACLPGPSAVITALVLSGFPPNKFAFEGFLSPKTGTKTNQLLELKFERRTMIFFESPYKIKNTIDCMINVFGKDREICICREMTKKHQEIIRGSLEVVKNLLSNREIKGELSVVLRGSE